MAASPSSPDHGPGRPLRLAAYRLLARRAYAAPELAERLRRRGFDASEVETTIAALTRQGYLNDRVTAMQWTRSWRDYKGWGPGRIRAELLRRGIGRGLAQEVLDEGCPERETEATAMAVAVRLVKRPAFRRAGRRKAGWLAAQLMRRGFSGGLMWRVVRQCCSSQDDGEMMTSLTAENPE